MGVAALLLPGVHCLKIIVSYILFVGLFRNIVSHRINLNHFSPSSLQLSDPGSSPSLVFLYGDTYPLPFYEPYGKSDYLQLSLSLSL